MSVLIALVESLRPRQWTKNFFLFAGILFSQNIFYIPLLVEVTLGCIIFCFLSGAVYIVNDLRDLEQDKYHPAKSRRAIASGRLKVTHAIIAVAILVPVCLAGAYLLSLKFLLVAVIYFALQMAYTFFLKHLVILDVFAIAFGFVLRVVAGAVIIEVEISSWLLICTILLSLFLAFNKRRHELVSLEEEAQSHRKVLDEYSPYLLDQMISVVTASTVMAYALYTMSPETVSKFGTKNLIFTVPFVLYGVFRYQYLVHKKGGGGNPENILVTDKPLIIDIILWAITAGIILYTGKG